MFKSLKIEAEKQDKALNEGHQVQTYKGFQLDWNDDNIDPEEGVADFSVNIMKGNDVIATVNGFRAARKYIDDNKLDNTSWVIKTEAAGEGDYYTPFYVGFCRLGRGESFPNEDDFRYTYDISEIMHKFFTDDIDKAAKFETREEAEDYAFDKGAFYEIWAEDQEPQDVIKVVRESDINEALQSGDQKLAKELQADIDYYEEKSDDQPYNADKYEEKIAELQQKLDEEYSEKTVKILFPEEDFELVDFEQVDEVLNETYSKEELKSMIGKIYNQQKIQNIYRRKKYKDDRLFAHTKCTKCGREKRVFLSNLIKNPDKYGSCICSDKNIDSKVDYATKLYTNQKLLRNNTSGYTGVSFVKSYSGKPYNKWRAYIEVDGVRTYLGDFTSKIKAIKARKVAGEKGVKWYKENRNRIMKDLRKKTKKYNNSKYREAQRKRTSVTVKD